MKECQDSPKWIASCHLWVMCPYVCATDVTFHHMDFQASFMWAVRLNQRFLWESPVQGSSHAEENHGLLIKEHFFSKWVSWCFNLREAQTGGGTVCFGEQQNGMKGETETVQIIWWNFNGQSNMHRGHVPHWSADSQSDHFLMVQQACFTQRSLCMCVCVCALEP